MYLLEQIYALASLPPDKRNVITTYLPFRNKGNSFDYSSVAGSVLECLLGKQLKNFDYESFKAQCLKEVGNKLTDDSILLHLQSMYFENNVLCKASPEFLLLGRQGQEKETAASKHLSHIFQSFLAQQPQYRKLESKANFIERIFLDILRSHLQDSQAESREAPYLPFITGLFVQDLHFLTHQTEYFLQQIESFLALYNFLYCAQLALNIRTFEQPQSRPLYFILDTEKANQERTNIQNYGYKTLYSAMGSVFPILSILEYLNYNEKTGFIKQPLWRYSEAIQQTSLCNHQHVCRALSTFAEQFRVNRSLMPHYEPPHDKLDTMRTLVHYALVQFDDPETSRHEIRDKYQKEFERHIAHHFVQSRGRAGKVLVASQDYLMLLTNLAIGDKQQLRFQELLKQFRARGVYFDKQSEQNLIAFYERIGNVTRLSDSGDAVYVSSTV